MDCTIHNTASVSVNAPRITAVELETTEILLVPNEKHQNAIDGLKPPGTFKSDVNDNELPSTGQSDCFQEPFTKSTYEDIADLGVTRQPINSPIHCVKNINFIIEEAIDGFEFLYSRPKTTGRIQFGENRTVVFDDEDKVNELVQNEKYAKANTLHVQTNNVKSVLKNRPVCIDVSYFEQDETSYLEDGCEEEFTESIPLAEDPADHAAAETWKTIERLFTLHDIPLEEVKEDVLLSLQRLATGVVETFRHKEQCYKFVGRQQSIEEIDQLEQSNDSLKCEVSTLKKRLEDEGVKWEVIDQTIAENDDLKQKVAELAATNVHLTKELELSPKWEDVDGLLEEDKELKQKIAELTSSNEALTEKCVSTQKLASQHGEEVKQSKRAIEDFKNEIDNLLSTHAELNAKNSELSSSNKQLTEQLSNACIKLQKNENIEKENGELKLAKTALMCTNSKLTSSNSDMRLMVGKLREENTNMVRKMKSMKKRVYSRFFVENVALTVANEDLTQKLAELDSVKNVNEELRSTTIELASTNAKILLEKDNLSSSNSELSSNIENLTKSLEQMSTEIENWKTTYQRVKTEYECAKSDVEFVTKLYDSKIKELSSGKASIEAEQVLLKEQTALKVTLFSQVNEQLSKDKDALSEQLTQKLEEIQQLRSQLKEGESSIIRAQQWQVEEEICLSCISRLQEENSRLLKKCSELEVRGVELVKENSELNSFKDDFKAFDEKYDWLESVALSLRQEKEHSDSQVKDLKRQLRASIKAVESLEKAKSQSKKKPQELQNQLQDLQMKHSQLSKEFHTKERELEQALDKMQELAAMLRGTMSLARTSPPLGWGISCEANALARSPSRRWSFKRSSSFTLNRGKKSFFPRSVVS